MKTDRYIFNRYIIKGISKQCQWFKSCIGLEISETSRDVAFCAFAILSGTKDVFVIPDAHSVQSEQFTEY